MSDSQNNRIPDLTADGASVPETIMRLEEQLLQIWQENSVQKIEMNKKEMLLIKKKVMFLDHTITSMTAIIIKQAGTIQELKLANEKLQLDVNVKTLLRADKSQSEGATSSTKSGQHCSAKLAAIFDDWKSDEASDSEEESGPYNAGLPFQLIVSSLLCPAPPLSLSLRWRM